MHRQKISNHRNSFTLVLSLLYIIILSFYLSSNILSYYCCNGYSLLSQATNAKSKSLLNNDNNISSLKDYQQQFKPIVTSFQPKPYIPHPLFINEHIQTILGVFLRDEEGCAYINPNAKNIMEEITPIGIALIKKLPMILGFIPSETNCDYWDNRERIRTKDGDFFDVDYKYVSSNSGRNGDNVDDDIQNGNSISKGLVVIVHGLESNSNSTVCVNMARSFHSYDFDVACINFRGCSGTPNDTIYQYVSDEKIMFEKIYIY